MKVFSSSMVTAEAGYPLDKASERNWAMNEE
jgi:hypothetical protein